MLDAAALDKSGASILSNADLRFTESLKTLMMVYNSCVWLCLGLLYGILAKKETRTLLYAWNLGL